MHKGITKTSAVHSISGTCGNSSHLHLRGPQLLAQPFTTTSTSLPLGTPSYAPLKPHKTTNIHTLLPTHIVAGRSSATLFSASRHPTSAPHIPQASFADAAIDEISSDASPLINREVVLFLFQLEMDAQLQRALTYEDFAAVQDIRKRREKIDQCLAEIRQIKGKACGSCYASHSEELDRAPQMLSLRVKLNEAVAQEDFTLAAELRDRLNELESQIKGNEAAQASTVPNLMPEPRFSLGEMVVHTSKGYRAVVCGWDLACCESESWQETAGVSSLRRGKQQIFYHVLIDTHDWPGYTAAADLLTPEDSQLDPPVAYIAEELLDAASLANFESLEPLNDFSFSHPYSYYMFLGSDGHGNMIPCRQLRDKYNVQRQDVFPPWHRDSESDSDFEEDDDNDGDGGPSSSGGGGDGLPPLDGDSGWGGGSRIPGIDMRSLE